MWKWKTCHFFVDVLTLIACLLKYARNPPLCSCDCIPHGSLMAHEELCSPSERIICHREQEHTGKANSTRSPSSIFRHLSPFIPRAFNIRGQINWLPAAEDTYLPASQLCTGDPPPPIPKLGSTLLHWCWTVKERRRKKRKTTGKIPAKCDPKTHQTASNQ